jgi:pimeloyl-ACP methyl ester carboxylesterase
METEAAISTMRTADGRTIAWTECGARRGMPVVWFHGAPGSRLDASPDGPYAVGYAAAGIRLIAVDRAGYGASEACPKRDFSRVADDVALVADALQLGRFAVLGYSAGAAPALVTAARLTDRVAAVGVLAGIAPPTLADHGDLGERELFDLARRAPADLRAQLAELAALLRTDAAAAAMSMLGGLLTDADHTALADPRLAALLMTTLAESARQDLTGYADDIDALLDDWSGELASVRQTVHVVHGAQDRVVPPRHGRALAATLPSAEYAEVDGGHISVLTTLPSLIGKLATS